MRKLTLDFDRIENWLMINSKVSVERIIDLREFAESISEKKETPTFRTWKGEDGFSFRASTNTESSAISVKDNGSQCFISFESGELFEIIPIPNEEVSSGIVRVINAALKSRTRHLSPSTFLLHPKKNQIIGVVRD